MRRVRVIPTLLIESQRLVKTSKFRSPNYIGDPINAVRIFNEKEVDEICILDISATRSKMPPDLEYIKLLTSECFMPLSYGGGVATVDHALKLLQAGVEKIVLGKTAAHKPDVITEIAKSAGSSAIVVSMDVKKDWLGRPRIFVLNGTQNTGIAPIEFAKKMEDLGAGEILLQGIDRDGLFTGYDVNQISEISRSVGIPVIASCGAASTNDFVNAIRAGASAVAAGAMFVYRGSRKSILISYPDQQVLTNQLYSKL